MQGPLKPSTEKLFDILDFKDVDGLDISHTYMVYREASQNTIHHFHIAEEMEAEESEWCDETTVNTLKEMAKQLIEAGCDPEEEVLIHCWW